MMRFYKKGITFLLLMIVFMSYSQVVEVNKLDDKGNKHGLWKGEFKESKRPRYQGAFEHGKETGMFRFFDDTKEGVLIATREFNAIDNSVYTIIYDQKSNKVSEGKAINKLFEGEWKYYHANSKEIMTLENYKDGKLEGIRSVFYPNTKIAEETHYQKGIKEGPYKKYTENGILLEETVYKKGEFDGITTYKDPNDKIVAKGLYKNGLKVGIWQFFENGKLTSEENYNKPRKRIKFKNNEPVKIKK
jgi:antitoxin component YwqK of YwqJK toxin-antitoxin module